MSDYKVGYHNMSFSPEYLAQAKVVIEAFCNGEISTKETMEICHIKEDEIMLVAGLFGLKRLEYHPEDKDRMVKESLDFSVPI